MQDRGKRGWEEMLIYKLCASRLPGCMHTWAMPTPSTWWKPPPPPPPPPPTPSSSHPSPPLSPSPSSSPSSSSSSWYSQQSCILCGNCISLTKFKLNKRKQEWNAFFHILTSDPPPLAPQLGEKLMAGRGVGQNSTEAFMWWRYWDKLTNKQTNKHTNLEIWVKTNKLKKWLFGKGWADQHTGLIVVEVPLDRILSDKIFHRSSHNF